MWAQSGDVTAVDSPSKLQMKAQQQLQLQKVYPSSLQTATVPQVLQVGCHVAVRQIYSKLWVWHMCHHTYEAGLEPLQNEAGI